ASAAPPAGGPCSSWPCPSLRQPEQMQPHDAAIGNSVEAHMGDRPEIGHLALEEMDVVGLQLLLRQQGAPEHRLGDRRLVGAAGEIAGLDRASVGVVALVEVRVDLDALDATGMPELENGPFVARLPAASGLPAVAHRLAAPGQ